MRRLTYGAVPLAGRGCEQHDLTAQRQAYPSLTWKKISVTDEDGPLPILLMMVSWRIESFDGHLDRCAGAVPPFLDWAICCLRVEALMQLVVPHASLVAAEGCDVTSELQLL